MALPTAARRCCRNRLISPTHQAHSSKPAVSEWDRQMGTVPFHRPCSAYYAGSAYKMASSKCLLTYRFLFIVVVVVVVSAEFTSLVVGGGPAGRCKAGRVERPHAATHCHSHVTITVLGQHRARLTQSLQPHARIHYTNTTDCHQLHWLQFLLFCKNTALKQQYQNVVHTIKAQKPATTFIPVSGLSYM